MNIVLFQQIIQDNVVGNISEEMILCLIRAGMDLTNVSLWKTFAIARDSSYEVINTMKYTRSATLKTGQNRKQTNSRRVTNAEPRKSERKKKSFNTTNNKAATFKKSQSSGKQSCSADTGNILNNVSDLEKSFDSQETISEVMTETEFNSVMSKP